jgi:hypothetical protein
MSWTGLAAGGGGGASPVDLVVTFSDARATEWNFETCIVRLIHNHAKAWWYATWLLDRNLLELHTRKVCFLVYLTTLCQMMVCKKAVVIYLYIITYYLRRGFKDKFSRNGMVYAQRPETWIFRMWIRDLEPIFHSLISLWLKVKVKLFL